MINDYSLRRQFSSHHNAKLAVCGAWRPASPARWVPFFEDLDRY